MSWLPPSPARLPSGLAQSTDWLWGGLGISIASASASFAGYMIVTTPSALEGSPEFGIFAHLDHRTSQPAEVASLVKPRPDDPARPNASAEPALDSEPTGSIPPPVAASISTMSRATKQEKLRDFVVRDVFGNRALIEHGQKLSLVKQGSILDDAGEVLAIERHGGSWVVRTASGVIGGL